ncbi:hypothetical protein FA15DRAFT_599267, partial [Coprinopsis marcescibilis]
MLSKDGIAPDASQTHDNVTVCSACFSSLTHRSVPRFAMANKLYHGYLPDEFCDLTWVEEMACAIYRSTAHVTRLFSPGDPDKQPRQLHGNTCAHEMNIISTANILPCTPADLNGMILLVFISPKAFDPAKSGTLYRVRKCKIWPFLVWLKHHNRLYENMEFDQAVLDLYPDDGSLPGLAEAT